MKLHYSVSLWNFFHGAELPELESALRNIRALGYGIELWGMWGAVKDLYSPRYRPRLKAALAGMPVTMHSAIVHREADHRVQVDTAAALGAPILVVHSDEFYVEGRRELDLPLLRAVVAYAGANGVTIALENGQLPILEQAIAAAPDLRICLDVGHVYLTDRPMRAFLDALCSRIVHLHLQDILSPLESGLPETGPDHYIPGSGGIPHEDWLLLVQTLREIDYSGRVVLEVRPRNPYQTARQGFQFFDRLIAAGAEAGGG